MEASRRGRLLGVPAHLLRQAVADGLGYLRSRATGDAVSAFEREVRLWFVAGFVRERTWVR
jgi:hypothetical protein